MKKAFLATLLTTTFLTPALADEITANSKIDAVTVFPQGAEITRLVKTSVKNGEHTLILDDLPGDVDPQSIRVSSTSNSNLEIRSIDSNHVYVTSDAQLAGQRKELETEIETLQDQITAFNQQIQTLNYQRKLIQDSAIRPITVSQNNTDTQSSTPDLGSLFDLVAQRLQKLDEQSLKLKINIRNTTKQINDLDIKLSEIAPKQYAKLNVAVNFAATENTSAEFLVKYRIQNAGWQPFYDARLEIGAKNETPELELIRRAQIVQHTSENWENVALTLSTTRSTGATSAPELLPTEFMPPHFKPAIKSKRYGSEDLREQLSSMQSEVMADKTANGPEPVSEKEMAQAFTAGFQAAYKISGRYTVDNKGTAKKVKISAESLSASLSIHAAPALDLNAYLTASFTPKGANPLLPGRVMLFRDNIYMGQGYVPLIASGEEHELGFGIDDQIKITRSEVKRKTGESGILTTERVEDNSWITKVNNLHDRKMNVKIYDRMPYAVNENIEVSLMRNTTKPSKKDIEDKRGIYGWEYDIKPGKEETIKFGYRITHPQS